MKYLKLYKLLLEDMVDDIIKLHPKYEGNKSEFKQIYGYISQDINQNNKFRKFFEWILSDYNTSDLLAEIENLKEIAAVIEELFRGYLKYNIDLNKFDGIDELDTYIDARESVRKLDNFDNNVKKIYEDNSKVVLRVWNYEGMKKYGARSWCIVKSEKHWNSYTIEEERTHYLILYKTSNPIYYTTDGGQINLNKTCVQVDLKGKLYVIDAGNEYGAGIPAEYIYNILNDFIKIPLEIKFVGFNYDSKENLKLFLDRNPKFIYKLDTDSPLYKIFINFASNEDISILDKKKKWFELIANNNITGIKAMLDNGYDINTKNKEGRSAVFNAIVYQHYDILEFLLKDPNIDPNIKDDEGYTIFSEYWNLNDKIVNLIIDCPKFEINLVDFRNLTLLSAVIYCYVRNYSYTFMNLNTEAKILFNVIEKLIKNSKVELNNIFKINSDTNLIKVCKDRYWTIAELLIKEKRCDINIKDEEEYTALYYTILRCDNIDFIKLFLKRDDINVNDIYSHIRDFSDTQIDVFHAALRAVGKENLIQEVKKS